ncbi:prolyl 4-hydroxylase subunit alpha-1-like [Tubulanus polymorphus]|uniref:prolyl 4-hydroxylase subunit alpha-1-like n=1 Tax=Tubulanus polymorphus TaxID=672921 RepID=UPI003DA1CBBD
MMLSSILFLMLTYSVAHVSSQKKPTGCFASVNCIERALFKESSLIHEVDQLWLDVDPVTVDKEPELSSFRNFVQKTRLENSEAIVRGSRHQNAINLFHQTRRMAIEWKSQLQSLSQLLAREPTEPRAHWYCEATRTQAVPAYGQKYNRQQTMDKLREFIDKAVPMISGRSWLDDMDMMGASNALFQMRKVYQLSIDDLIAGRLIDGVVVKPLDAEDLRLVCQFIFEQNLIHKQAELWGQKWLEVVDRTNPDGYEDALLHYANLLYKRNDPYRALEIVEHIRIIYPNKTGLDEFEAELRSAFNKGSCSLERPVYPHYMKDIAETYDNLCNQHSYISNLDPAMSMTLTCRYEETTIPYIRALVEYANLDPVIKVYHKIISDKEILGIKTITGSHLKQAEVFGGSVTFSRQAQNAWLSPLRSPLTKKLMKRVQLLTGLSTKVNPLKWTRHSEDLQVGNYGPGGFYESHFDSSIAYNDTSRAFAADAHRLYGSQGDRIATWMFYFSDVGAGGRTVFPKINVTIPVTKGSAAFWYNLHRNGSPDMRTLHAGCPVLLGSKWVGNLWILEGGQTFRHSCSIDSNI